MVSTFSQKFCHSARFLLHVIWLSNWFSFRKAEKGCLFFVWLKKNLRCCLWEQQRHGRNMYVLTQRWKFWMVDDFFCVCVGVWAFGFPIHHPFWGDELEERKNSLCWSNRLNSEEQQMVLLWSQNKPATLKTLFTEWFCAIFTHWYCGGVGSDYEQ